MMSFLADSVKGRTLIGDPMSSAMPSSPSSSTVPASLPSHGSTPVSIGADLIPGGVESRGVIGSSSITVGVGSGSSIVSPGLAGATTSRTWILPPTTPVAFEDLNADGR